MYVHEINQDAYLSWKSLGNDVTAFCLNNIRSESWPDAKQFLWEILLSIRLISLHLYVFDSIINVYLSLYCKDINNNIISTRPPHLILNQGIPCPLSLQRNSLRALPRTLRSQTNLQKYISLIGSTGNRT